jgi:hypothetical protein
MMGGVEGRKQLVWIVMMLEYTGNELVLLVLFLEL